MDKKKALYKKAVKAYDAGDRIMSDSEFDILEAEIRAEDPSWDKLEISSKKSKHKLPVFLPSLHKVYPKSVMAWRNKRGKLYESDKLDGNSLVITFKGGKPIGLHTRGNGTKGGKVSHWLPHLCIDNIKEKGVVYMRVEAIFRDVDFKKYAKEFDNARNAVAGLLNRKLGKPHAALKDIVFVCLGVYGVKPSETEAWCKRNRYASCNKFREVKFENAEQAQELLAARRKESWYTIDGLVLTEDVPLAYASADKPRNAIAFKDNIEDEGQITTVTRVDWRISPAGRITPRIFIEPVPMEGVVVTKATAHNVAWMLERGVGAGAEIKIIRSGDVIPKIIEVLAPAPLGMPSVPHVQRGRFLHTVDTTDTQRIRNVARFLTTMGVETIKEATVRKMSVREQYLELDTWQKMALKPSDYRDALLDMGFGKKQTENMLKELAPLKKLSVGPLLSAMNAFPAAFNVGRFELLQKQGISLMELLALKRKARDAAIDGMEVKGFANKLKSELKEGLTRARPLYRKFKHVYEPKAEDFVEVKTEGRFSGMTAIWTGYRDKAQEKYWTENGGTVGKGVNKDTTYVFYRKGGKASTKIEKAGDRAVEWEQVCP